MKISVTLLAIASLSVIGVVACDKSSETSTTTTTSTAADNTRQNARDDAASVTPLDQGNDSADIRTTAAVRKALMADDTLSTNAKNIKIVTANGTLSLRGPVGSEAEKQTIDAKARSLAGANKVDDGLDVTATK